MAIHPFLLILLTLLISLIPLDQGNWDKNTPVSVIGVIGKSETLSADENGSHGEDFPF